MFEVLSMNTRPIDKSKKSNIKCEHCTYWEYKEWCRDSNGEFWDKTYGKCMKTDSKTDYWKRCKQFKWKEGKNYIESSE